MHVAKKIVLAAAMAVAVAVTAPISYAAEATVGVDVATAYVFRGGTLNDSFVAQPYVEVGGEGLGGFTIGTWANFDLDDGEGGAPESGNFSEVDLYASYEVPLDREDKSLSLGYTEYTYPHAGGAIVTNGGAAVSVDGTDADRELNIVGGCTATAVDMSLGVYFGVDGAIEEQIYAEGTVGYDLELSEDNALSLSATVAAILNEADGSLGETGIAFVSLSAGTGIGPLDIGVTYYIETDDDVQAIDDEVVGTVGVSHDF